jgi:hypothetical protein
MADAALFPRVHVMVICDEIEQTSGDPDTFNLQGVRSEIKVPGFPYTHPQLSVYMQVSGRQGRVRCHVEVIEAVTDTVLFTTDEQEIALTGPLTLMPIQWLIADCEFLAPEYTMFKLTSARNSSMSDC